jgi:DNA-binding beta-propeller fold protein YncE
MLRKPSALYVLIAAVALSVGLLVYLLDRQPEHTYFLSHGLNLGDTPYWWFGVAGNHLPAFLHVYAFMLLTVAVTDSSDSRLIRIGTAWFVIASLFEFGQHSSISPLIAASLPAGFAHIPVLDNTAAYFLRGAFDPLDFLAIVLGTVAAGLTVVATRNGKRFPSSGGLLRRLFRCFAVGGTTLVGMLAIVGSGGSGESNFIPGSGDASKLYISGNASDALLVYDAANSVTGNTAASRTVTGLSTTLNAPRGIAVDMARNQIYIANFSSNSILVFSNARTMTGDTVPSRVIAGATTTLNGPSALFFDMFNDRLYVANTTANTILVFNSASTTSGDVAPDRTLAGVDTTLNAPYGVFVDATRNKLYVINNGANSILAFDDAASVSGNTVPARTISGVSTTLSGPSGGALDVLQDRLYVANTVSDSILVFNDIGANATSGNMPPNRTLAAAALNQPLDLYLDIAGDRLYVANAGGDSVLVLNNASTVTGATAPDRVLTLTAGTTPYGVFVDVTPVVVGSTADLDGEAGSDNTATSAGGAPRTGDVDSFPADIAYRQFYSFDLSGLPAGTIVSAATLRLYQASVTGAPYDGTLGSIVIDHVNYGASLDGTDYAIGALLSNVGALSSDGSVGYRTLSVASRVQDDLSNGRTRTQYRLRFSLSDANLNGNDDYAQFTDFEDSCCSVNRPPQLTITIQP